MSSGEQEVFQEGDILVSTARIRLHGGKTYSTANVTSVSTKITEYPNPSKQGPVVLMGIGGVLGLIGLGSLGDNVVGGAFWVLVAAAVVYGGFLWFRRIRKPEPDYILLIGSASGESEGMQSKDKGLIQRVAEAINEAIVARG